MSVCISSVYIKKFVEKLKDKLDGMQKIIIHVWFLFLKDLCIWKGDGED